MRERGSTWPLLIPVLVLLLMVGAEIAALVWVAGELRWWTLVLLAVSAVLGLALMRRIKLLIPANYRAIAARDIAQAMVQAMQSAKPGTQLLLSGQMQA